MQTYSLFLYNRFGRECNSYLRRGIWVSSTMEWSFVLRHNCQYISNHGPNTVAFVLVVHDMNIQSEWVNSTPSYDTCNLTWHITDAPGLELVWKKQTRFIVGEKWCSKWDCQLNFSLINWTWCYDKTHLTFSDIQLLVMVNLMWWNFGVNGQNILNGKYPAQKPAEKRHRISGIRKRIQLCFEGENTSSAHGMLRN